MQQKIEYIHDYNEGQYTFSAKNDSFYSFPFVYSGAPMLTKYSTKALLGPK